MTTTTRDFQCLLRFGVNGEGGGVAKESQRERERERERERSHYPPITTSGTLGWVWQRGEEKKDETNQKASFSPGLSLERQRRLRTPPRTRNHPLPFKKVSGFSELAKDGKMYGEEKPKCSLRAEYFFFICCCKVVEYPPFRSRCRRRRREEKGGSTTRDDREKRGRKEKGGGGLVHDKLQRLWRKERIRGMLR